MAPKKRQKINRSRFWFDDGNVILQAESTQFRVHRSLLSLHSNLFRDMFSMPQPTDTTTIPHADGCPVISLADKASDLEYVLSIFYENFRVQEMRDLMPIDFLSAILRLGKKYEIDYICNEGLSRLRFDFPNTLEKWDVPFDEHCKTDYDGREHNLLQLCYEPFRVVFLPPV
ncbi:hypothetical protein M413DRAFT_376605 [Hebeloma cylindrosporum]|uniref:BTB domain-containing protein n=1 Tax=Hebeloma cylindrosporum TaxID=76867 RepID=A0A0C2Y2Z3_HEBCY|nr:hypothetical protein M413DRAFT_376605 [Hebeloma cylindrosporum h7]